MIPILFNKNETAFTSNGIGRLVDCISCTCTEERNGVYEVEFDYPITGKWYKEMINNGGIIGVIHDDNHDVQPFDIYAHNAPINGVVTFYAHHISYRLNNIILSPYEASSASAAVAGISTHSVNTNPFTFTTDKTTTANFKLKTPDSVRAILFGQEGSLLDTFGTAEFKFDKFNVQMLLHRGTDTGVTVRYGKNMTGFEQERDSSECFSAVAPYWMSENDVVYLPEYIVGPTTAVTPVVPAPLDMSSDFTEKPTVDKLREAAKKYLDKNTPWKTDENITIDFVALWQSPEYENVAEIQRVGLCDTVSVYYTDMGVVAEQTKVVRVVYNVLAERYDEVELGDLSKSYVAIESAGSAAEKTASTTAVKTLTVGTSNADITYNSTYISTLHRYSAKQIGNLVVFSFVATVTSTPSATALFTLPSNLQPSSQIDFIFAHSSAGIINGAVSSTINNHTQSLAAGAIRGEVVWTVA